MAYYNNNGYGSAGGNGGNGSSSGINGHGAGGSNGPVETEELSAEDYAIIAAGFGVLGELFTFFSLVKAKQVTQETGGKVGPVIDPVLFVQNRKKKQPDESPAGCVERLFCPNPSLTSKEWPHASQISLAPSPSAPLQAEGQ